MRNNEVIKRRNQMIFDKYNEMFCGQMLREEAIYPVLQEQFFLNKGTLYLIILQKSKEVAKSI